MTEQRIHKEQGGRREILDFDKYGALYGRFLLASQALEAEISNIIDPTTPVEFNFPVDKVPLDKRNYNPVFENLSHRERQDRWKEVPLFDDAYRQWRAEFTRSMKNIKKDSNRELALKAILPDKDAATFVEADANALFQKFCAGKSDTHKFISQITKHVIDSKINSTSLQALLPDLEWIASGLFGKQTASMVTRLIEVESSMHNDPVAVLKILKEKGISTPTDDEKKILGLLHNSFPVPQEEAPEEELEVSISDVGTTPVAPEETPAPTTEAVQPPVEPAITVVPAEVPEAAAVAKPTQDELPSPPWRGATLPPPVKKFPEVVEDEDDKDELLPPPAPPVRPKDDEILPLAKEIPVPAFKLIPIEGERSDYTLQIKINGKDTGFKWRKVGEGYYFSNTEQLVDPNKLPDSIVVPEGAAIELEYKPGDDVRRNFNIVGGKDTRIPLSRKVSRIWFFRESPEYMFMQIHGKIYEAYSGESISFDDFEKLMAEPQPEKIASSPAKAELDSATHAAASEETATREDIAKLIKEVPDTKEGREERIKKLLDTDLTEEPNQETLLAIISKGNELLGAKDTVDPKVDPKFLRNKLQQSLFKAILDAKDEKIKARLTELYIDTSLLLKGNLYDLANELTDLYINLEDLPVSPEYGNFLWEQIYERSLRDSKFKEAFELGETIMRYGYRILRPEENRSKVRKEWVRRMGTALKKEGESISDDEFQKFQKLGGGPFIYFLVTDCDLFMDNHPKEYARLYKTFNPKLQAFLKETGRAPQSLVQRGASKTVSAAIDVIDKLPWTRRRA